MERDPAHGAPDGAETLAPRPFTVVRRVAETGDTVTLALEPPPGAERPAFRPGQFNMLYRFGVGEVAISIAGDADAPGELVHTVRSAGRITAAICRAG